MLGDIYLCASMIDAASFEERVEAASRAGYAGIGMRPTHYAAARSSGLSGTDMRVMLDEQGVELIEIGFLTDWWEMGEKAARSREYEQELFELKDVLGGRHVMLITGPLDRPADDIAACFAGVCDRAAEHGLRVGLEFLPWTDAHNAAMAWRIAELSGRQNGGLVLDTWHINRGGTSEDMLRSIPARCIVAIQISDGGFDVVETDMIDALSRRMLPGEGEFGIRRFVELMESRGVTAPVGVEVLSDELRVLPPADAARLGIEATRAVLGR
jgi:sugar phosphate isomerase/epimerase